MEYDEASLPRILISLRRRKVGWNYVARIGRSIAV
jgi:hypothetical protein